MPYQVIILFIVTITGTVFSYFLLKSEKKAVNILFAIFSISTSAWALFLGLFLNENDLTLAHKFANSYYMAAAAIPTIFYFFSTVFKKTVEKFNKIKLFFLLPLLVISLAILSDHSFIIKEVFLNEGFVKDVILNKTHYYLYAGYFILFVGLSYFELIKTHKHSNNSVARKQLKYVVGGTFLGYILGMVFNLLLPVLGNYELIWIGPLSVLVMVGSVGFSIVKHHLFDLKVIVTELLVFLLWAFILIRTILSGSIQEQISNGVLLLITITIGILLIRSVSKEVRIRQRLEILTKDLERANSKLTELDQLKTEFLSLASHQFRSPLTAMKGYASLILEGSFGVVNPAVKDAVSNIFQSSNNLAEVVQDFLDVSRIEQGRMKYEFEKTNMKELTANIISELKPNITKAGLDIILDAPHNDYFVNADRGKMNQVLINLIDNAQKYTKWGSIKISLSKSNRRILLKVSDTGMGISKDDLPKLFEKFVRSKDANEVNVKGTGLGLYIVKKIVEAHHGKIWAESLGVGKGATFTLELSEI